MRLIDADALEKEMCSGCEYSKSKYANCDDCAIAHAPTIEAEPVRHGEWIPCSERLPEDGVAVLITTENEEVYIDQVITDPYKERYFQSNTAYDNFQVIAWMPLPKPYREDSEV